MRVNLGKNKLMVSGMKKHLIVRLILVACLEQELCLT